MGKPADASRDRALASRAEVASFLGVPAKTLTQWAYRGTGPAYLKVGRYARYRWRDVETWLDAQRVT